MSDRLVSDSTTIDAPPAVVFAIVSDPRQHPRIDGSGSLQGVITGPERLTAKGDTFGMDMKLFGVPYKIRNLVVELEPDRRIGGGTSARTAGATSSSRSATAPPGSPRPGTRPATPRRCSPRCARSASRPATRWVSPGRWCG